MKPPVPQLAFSTGMSLNGVGYHGWSVFSARETGKNGMNWSPKCRNIAKVS